MLISDWLRISEDEYNNIEEKLDDIIDKQQIVNFWMRLIFNSYQRIGKHLETIRDIRYNSIDEKLKRPQTK